MTGDILPMYGGVDECLRHLDESRRELLELLGDVDESTMTHRPDDETWSIAMIAEHIALAEMSAAKVIRLLRRGADAASFAKRPVEPGRRRPDGRAIAPALTEPTGRLGRADVHARLADARGLLLEVVASGEHPIDRDAHFPHPFFGALNGLGWLQMAAYHEHHHLQQIRTRTAQRST